MVSYAGMRYRQLGNSGLTVSVVGLGTNNFGRRCDLEQTRAVVAAALDAGITFIDTADVYGNGGDSERFLGEALKGHRHEVVLATKFGLPMPGRPETARGSRRYIRLSIEGSLRRLQTDYVDLYQFHRPDPLTPIEETLAALDELVSEGKVRYIGASNMTGWQATEAEWVARFYRRNRFISAQNQYNLLQRGIEADLVPVCMKYGIGILPFYPLANGLLTGKYRRGQPAPLGTRGAEMPERFTETMFQRAEALESFARERGLSLLQVAIGGLAAQPAMGSVMAGATRPEQVRANADAADWVPTAEDLAAIDAIVPPGRAAD